MEGTGLLGPGSRINYRLMFAGAAEPIAALRQWLLPQVKGLRLLSVDDTQRGVRQAFDLAGRFLGLSALLAVLLAGVATALAANRFALRRIDQVAILRCLGARQRDILSGLALQLLMLAVPACALGIGLGIAAQEGLVQVLGTLREVRPEGRVVLVFGCGSSIAELTEALRPTRPEIAQRIAAEAV